VLQHFFGEKEWTWTYFLFLQNFITPHPAMMGEAWSLSVEEWFYISFPLTLFGLLFFFEDKKKGFLFLTLLYVLLFTVIRIYFTLELSEKVVAKRFDSMFTGIAQYEILNNINKVTTELSKLNVDENQLDIKRLPESTTTTAAKIMIQEILVYIIIFAAIVYVVYSVVRSLRTKDKASSGCDGCSGCDLKHEVQKTKTINKKELKYDCNH
jgi:hypothetical protein